MKSSNALVILALMVVFNPISFTTTSQRSSSDLATSDENIEFVTVFESQWNYLTEKTEKVIMSNGEWVEFWKAIHFNVSPVPETAFVDFSEKALIVVSLGARSSTGYDIKVKQIVSLGAAAMNSIKVTYVETTPGKSCGTGLAITYPLTVVAVSRIPINMIIFEKIDVEISCGEYTSSTPITTSVGSTSSIPARSVSGLSFLIVPVTLALLGLLFILKTLGNKNRIKK